MKILYVTSCFSWLVLAVNTWSCFSSDTCNWVGSWLENASVAKEETDRFNPNLEGIWSPFCGKFVLALLWAWGSQHIRCWFMPRSCTLSALNFVNLFLTKYNQIQNLLLRRMSWVELWCSVRTSWFSGNLEAQLQKNQIFLTLIFWKRIIWNLTAKYSHRLLLGIIISNIVCTF